jgi:LysM repeat protein
VPGRRLRPGTELIIPIPPSRVVTARHEREPRTAEAPDGRRVRYRIRQGDTLGSIAAQYGRTVQELQAWNGLHGSRIAVGHVLTIYTASAQD